MASKEQQTQPPSQSQLQSLPQKEETIPTENADTTSGSNVLYISNYYQVANLDASKTQFLNSLKYQSPTRAFPNRDCCSPSFFIDFTGARPTLSPAIETPPSHLGSTYTAKHLTFAKANANKPPISSFDADIERSAGGTSSSKETSPIVCKNEQIEEESKGAEVNPAQEVENQMQTRRARLKRLKILESEDAGKNLRKVTRGESSKQGKRTPEKGKEEKQEIETKVEQKEASQAVQALDALIQNLNRKVNSMPRESQEEMVIEDPGLDYGIQISSNNFQFESDSEEKNELLTEEESLAVLKGMWNQKKPKIQFMLEVSDPKDITDTILIDESGLRQNGAHDLKFLRTDERALGKLLLMPDHIGELPLHLSKKISKLTNQENYQCKYCGKQFQKGCALGGHISRLHKGESLNFRMRQETRKKRIADRTRGKFLRKESVKQLENKDEM